MGRATRARPAVPAESGRLLRQQARSWLTRQRRHGAEVYRVTEEGPGIWWVLYSMSGNAHTAIAAGAKPAGWRLVSECEGWPVP